MARPHSVPDFSQYLAHIQSSPTRHRKKPSISLAAGLIMAGESPKTATPSSPDAKAGAFAVESNLFYAYAQKVRSPYTTTSAHSKLTHLRLTRRTRLPTSSPSPMPPSQTGGGKSSNRSTRPVGDPAPSSSSSKATTSPARSRTIRAWGICEINGSTPAPPMLAA